LTEPLLLRIELSACYNVAH